MKILYICNEYPPCPHGGIGIFTKFLAESLVSKGHEVIVIGYDSSIQKRITEELNGVSVSRYPFQLKKRKKIGALWAFLKERMILSSVLRSHISIFNPDIVESYDWSGPLMWKPRCCHLVVRMHGARTVNSKLMGKKQSALQTFFEKRNLKYADSLVSVSNFIGEKTASCFGLESENITTIYNGVDTTRFSSRPLVKRDRNRLLFVGRIHEYKGLDLLLEAMKIVFCEHDEVYLDVVASCCSKQIASLVSGLPVEYRARIHFLGRAPNEDLPAVYSGAFLCIVPSRVEALGIVAIEAMACETPLVMSSLVAAGELINVGYDGYIVDPGDAVAFAGSILYALDHPLEVDAMRLICRAKMVDQFDLCNIVDENEKYYQRYSA